MYAKIETERLIFIHLNQTKLHSEEYIHLRDAVVNDEAIAYVCHYGRPDLFITIICNPTSDDIQKLLLPGQSPIDRHDITVRVFRQKLKPLMDFMIKYGSATYKFVDTVMEADEVVNYRTEYLNSFDLPGLPLHVLQLKSGVPIIILRNTNQPKLRNGTRLAVKKLLDNVVEATILTGLFKRVGKPDNL
ncbi:unnamed protein product [Onchocerca ochengi]|uniref:ATP-dependent DNA helicase n=1 Tax=Onchocerca ochengi TaxID=42157 RepID=A0A182ECD8_ONCOC|nr:unnamed protein product [Onchocerca ochengi]